MKVKRAVKINDGSIYSGKVLYLTDTDKLFIGKSHYFNKISEFMEIRKFGYKSNKDYYSYCKGTERHKFMRWDKLERVYETSLFLHYLI
jgi:hypothetical protein